MPCNRYGPSPTHYNARPDRSDQLSALLGPWRDATLERRRMTGRSPSATIATTTTQHKRKNNLTWSFHHRSGFWAQPNSRAHGRSSPFCTASHTDGSTRYSLGSTATVEEMKWISLLGSICDEDDEIGAPTNPPSVPGGSSGSGVPPGNCSGPNSHVWPGSAKRAY